MIINDFGDMIQTHRKEFPTHDIDPYNIEIIDRADTNYKVELKEALHINTKKPELNTQHAAAYKRKNKKDLSRRISTGSSSNYTFDSSSENRTHTDRRAGCFVCGTPVDPCGCGSTLFSVSPHWPKGLSYGHISDCRKYS